MTVSIPETINEITLEQFIKFDKANKGDDTEFLMHKLINIFCGVSMRDTLNISLHDAESIAEDVTELLSQDTPFQKTFEYNGKRWGFIPNLENISLGEFVDLDEYLKDTQNIHKAMSVLYRPITKEYKDLYAIEKYKGHREYSEELKGMPLGVATSATLFFYRLGRELVLHSKGYFSQLVKSNKTITQQKGNLHQNTDGLTVYINSLKEMSQSLTK